MTPPLARRYVLLRHDLPAGSGRASHDDLMLETDDGLFTLELPSPLAPGVAQIARELPTHRKSYLDYEGPISGDRGSVRRVARGEFIVETWTTDSIAVQLQPEGLTIAGTLRLNKVASADATMTWRVALDPA